MIKTTSISLRNCFLQIKQVLLPPRSRYLLLTLNFFLTLHSPITLKNRYYCSHIDLSSINCSGIARSLISRSSISFENKGKISALANSSLKDFLFEISDVVPEQARRIRRISELKPQDVLELLLGFRSEVANVGIQASKVECLWGIFMFANENCKNFKHFRISYEVMASLLIRIGKFKEVEFLLSQMEIEGILLDNLEIFSLLVEGFVSEGNLEDAVMMYDKMRQRCISPSLSCCYVFLDSLIKMKKTQLAFGVCLDMVEMGSGFGDKEKAVFENLIRLLCWQGKVLEARNLVKKFVALGFKPSNKVLYEITSGYCEKKDYEDLLSFFFEIKCPPDIISGNKIMHSLCKNFGSESACLYLRELEHTGFKPDEITFGILIGWSCCEGNLRNGFIYLSDLLLSGLKPDLHSYNALMSGLLKDGLWKHAQGILDEMVDRGTTPSLSTFKVLLAGYCKAKQFDEAKKIVLEMEKRGFIQLSSVDDLMCRIFSFLGFDPLAVRLKRDNNGLVSKTDFFDALGNGLYLETDMDEYEKRVIKVLEESMLPDFNLLLIEECRNGDWKAALNLAARMDQWGQEISLTGLTTLFKYHCELNSQIKLVTGLWEKKPDIIAQLGVETLNLIVQAYCKKGSTSIGLRILNEIIQMNLQIKKETYTVLIKSLCKIGKLRVLLGCWDRAQMDGWVPELHDCKSLVGYFCKKGKLKEVFSLLESMLVSHPHLRLDIILTFLEKLSEAGFAASGQLLVEELLSRGFSLDQKAYELLIIGFCKENNVSIAINILDDMMAVNIVPCVDVCLKLIPALCKAGRYETAIALKAVGTTESSFSSLRVCSALMKGLCMTGKVRKAFTLLQDMLFKGLSPNAEIYNLLVQGHCIVKSFGKVWEILGIMLKKDLTLSLSSYRKLVHLTCVEGRNFRALHLKDLMLRNGEFHGRIIYNILIFYIFRSKNSVFVGKILDELEKRKLLLDKVTYDFLVYGFSQCKDLSSSTYYLFTMIHQDLRPRNRSLNSVIRHLCDSGGFGKALELSHEMELRGWVHDSPVQNSIVESLISYGKLEEAEHFLDRMIEKCLVPRNIDYNNLIRQFCKHGRLSKAVDLINVMLKRGNTPNATSYDLVVQCCCNFNEMQKAMDFHTEMLDRGLKPNIRTWEKLVFSFCRNGQTTEAERLLISISQIGETPSKDAYFSMLNRYRLDGNLKKASETMRAMQQGGYELDFKTHWSLISNLRDATVKDDDKINNKGFLSALLSKSGFSRESIP